MSDARARRRPLRAAGEVPIALIDEMISDMGRRMSGTEEALRCAGLSFGFVVVDRRLRPARYEVLEGGGVVVERRDPHPATFVFHGDLATFDAILRGREHALTSVVRRRVHFHGSLLHLRSLLRMMPAVEGAYRSAREALVTRYTERYEFLF